jgi:predicted amidohydrolase
VLAERAEGEGVVLADLDMERLAAVRERLPSLRNRRLIGTPPVAVSV